MQIDASTTVLITGANGGIGCAIARTFHRLGAKIVVSGRRPDALKAIAEETNARVIVADLSKHADVDRCLAEAGDVDVFVANAALPSSGPLMAYSAEQIDRAIHVNLRSPIVMARHIAEGMVARKRGSIVFISSISGKVAAPGTSMYSATKFGLRGFALGLREDLYGTGVGVSTIFPGFIRNAGMFADTGVTLPKGAGTRSPEDVANAVLRAVRKNSAEITVAALEQSVGVFIAGLSHPFVTAMQRWMGGEKIAKQIAAAQEHKR